MKTFKAQLLVATIAAGGTGTAAQAQFAYPAVEVRGAGATTIQNIIVQTLNCNGNPGSHAPGNTDNLNLLGSNNGTTTAVPEGKFVQPNPTGASPDFDCNLQEIQPNFQGKFVAIGSSTGRAWWRSFTNQLDGSAGLINPFGTWTNLDFAFSPAPIAASDLAAYDAAANNSTNAAGAPIQFPLYVLPLALGYNPVYGRLRTADGVVELKFNVKPDYVTTDVDGNPTGGIRMTRNTYCKILNGYITNWNDKALGSSGVGNTLKDPQDNTARFKNEGVPIRLVGRLDSAGTTDILSRHLALACAGQAGVAVNKYATNAEALPFDKTSAIDLRGFRSDTRYYPNTTGALAGTVQSLSGAVFVRASGSTPARIDVTQGTEKAGLFLVADGNTGLRDALNYQLDPAQATGSIALNGKLGYIGSDFVKPATGAVLFSAALQIGGVGSKYASPTAEQAVAAFGTTRFLPPQTTSVNGNYDAGDDREGPRRDGQPGTVRVDRANPLHWTSVLYSNPSDTLAAPRVGYPLTGTVQYLGYTCYAADPKRAAMVEFLSLYTGRLTQDSNGDPISPSLLTSTKASAPGLLAQLNIGPMPASWLTAINDTFLRKSPNSNALAAKNLWIQDKLPKTSLKNSKSNPACTPGKGA